MKGIRIITAVFALIMVFSAGLIAEAATAKPAQVTGVRVKSSDCGEVKITFKKVKGASGYEIRYSEKKNGKYKKIATVKKASYTYEAGSGKKGYYKVRAYKTVKKKKVYGKYSAKKYKKAKKHKYGSYYISKKPTCTKKGKKYRKCSACGYKKYSSIAVDKIDGHNYVTKAPTCTKEGKKYCTHCKKVISTTKKLGHDYATSKVTQKATCTVQGVRTYYCSRCDKTKTKAIACIAHKYSGERLPYNADRHKVMCAYGCGNYTLENHTITVTEVKKPTVTQKGQVKKTCSVCGYTSLEDTVICNHTGSDIELRGATVTCTEAGYSGDKYCKIDKAIVEVGKNVPALGHDLKTVKNSKGYLVTTCSRCDYTKTDTTCYIDLSKKTISVPSVAEFGKTETNNRDVVKLQTDGVSDFEISGSATNFTILVYADKDVGIKLNGVTITNNSLGTTTNTTTGETENIIGDCIEIKDICTEKKQTTDDGGNVVEEKIVPVVSVSAKDGTTSTLKVNASGGNAIQSDAKLELKGHGTLKTDTVSTSIDARAKVLIRNLTLNIKSQNRGIDTKYTVTYDNGAQSEEYANIEFGANANVTINSTDDGIRCKNMSFSALEEDDVSSVVYVKSEVGDGLQLEGKKGLEMLSGSFELHSGTPTDPSKTVYDIKCKNAPAPTVSAAATLTYTTIITA
jgi:hypothetical protein